MRGIFLKINDKSEKVAVGTPHGIDFAREHPQSSKSVFWRWYVVQQYQRSPCGDFNLELREKS